jgi:hypothetical protein
MAATLFTACNNYGLKEKLENPGGSTDTETFTDRLFAFATSAVTSGDMQGLPIDSCSGTGYVRADCYCQQLAQKNNRRMSASSKFVAYLGETSNSMKCRIVGTTGSACSPVGSFVWYNTNFQPVFSGFGELFNAAPALTATLNFTESGAQLPAGQFVWTGTGADGVGNGSNCTGWTSTAGLGLYGQSDLTNTSWTNLNSQNCNLSAHIYCFAVP